MKKINLILILLMSVFVYNCGNSASGSEVDQIIVDQVQLTGELPGSIQAGKAFESHIRFVNGKILSADLRNEPEWVKIKTGEKKKELIIYGNAPSATGTHHVTLSVDGKNGSSFGFSFDLSVISQNKKVSVKQTSTEAKAKALIQ